MHARKHARKKANNQSLRQDGRQTAINKKIAGIQRGTQMAMHTYSQPVDQSPRHHSFISQSTSQSVSLSSVNQSASQSLTRLLSQPYRWHLFINSAIRPPERPHSYIPSVSRLLAHSLTGSVSWASEGVCI